MPANAASQHTPTSASLSSSSSVVISSTLVSIRSSSIIILRGTLLLLDLAAAAGGGVNDGRQGRISWRPLLSLLSPPNSTHQDPSSLLPSSSALLCRGLQTSEGYTVAAQARAGGAASQLWKTHTTALNSARSFGSASSQPTPPQKRERFGFMATGGSAQSAGVSTSSVSMETVNAGGAERTRGDPQKLVTFESKNGQIAVGVIRGDTLWSLQDVFKSPDGKPLPQVSDMESVIKNWSDLKDRLIVEGSGTKHPIVFTKAPQSVIGPGAAIKYPHGVSSAVDYEAELGVIIGKPGQSIKREDAMSHIFGYTIINDVTARDAQKRHQQWFLGKSCDTFCPMGPGIVPASEIDGTDLQIQCWINDELRQDGRTSQMIFGIPQLIEVISAAITLQPGDIIATGTPAGVGSGFNPPRHLTPGDKIKISIEGMGELCNVVE